MERSVFSPNKNAETLVIHQHLFEFVDRTKRPKIRFTPNKQRLSYAFPDIEGKS